MAVARDRQPVAIGQLVLGNVPCLLPGLTNGTLVTRQRHGIDGLRLTVSVEITDLYCACLHVVNDFNRRILALAIMSQPIGTDGVDALVAEAADARHIAAVDGESAGVAGVLRGVDAVIVRTADGNAAAVDGQVAAVRCDGSIIASCCYGQRPHALARALGVDGQRGRRSVTNSIRQIQGRTIRQNQMAVARDRQPVIGQTALGNNVPCLLIVHTNGTLVTRQHCCFSAGTLITVFI